MVIFYTFNQTSLIVETEKKFFIQIPDKYTGLGHSNSIGIQLVLQVRSSPPKTLETEKKSDSKDLALSPHRVYEGQVTSERKKKITFKIMIMTEGG